MMTKPDNETIAAFQEQRRQFQALWQRNFGIYFLPGFVLFAIGSQTDKLWLVLPGIGLCLVGAARGLLLVLRYRRCPNCGTIQTPRVQWPHRTCSGCGTQLSMSSRDST